MGLLNIYDYTLPEGFPAIRIQPPALLFLAFLQVVESENAAAAMVHIFRERIAGYPVIGFQSPLT